MEYPLAVALARSAPSLPTDEGWWFEPKLDGDRGVLWRHETVRIQTRSGRDATSQWLDIATAAMDLPPGTVLDGELVIWTDGRTDFGAVRARASARGRRLADLITRLPASYAAFDCVMMRGEDLRSQPYLERRAALLEVLEPLGPPLQVVPATDDLETARLWYDVLPEQGCEGVVAKRADGAYRPDRSWWKVRHTAPVDAVVVGYTGAPTRPKNLAVRLGDGRILLTRTLPAGQAAQVAPHLATATRTGSMRSALGEAYTGIDAGPVVEIELGTTRHAVAAMHRVRSTSDMSDRSGPDPDGS
ncbi:ATP-dependent DNA ligase [Streptomyces sp. NPDC059611]|uniref:ATP-dependent DNA ligase n=1 Tax=Streptomyces sp. NPDC059611 TaxID=3346884 RepID=UPI0036826ACC